MRAFRSVLSQNDFPSDVDESFDFLGEQERCLTKLREHVGRLERKAGRVLSIQTTVSSERDALLNLRQSVSEIRDRIAALNPPQLARSEFDRYELLKKSSHELQQKYLQIKQSLEAECNWARRCVIEDHMGEVQDEFTGVVVEIERFRDVTPQNLLRQLRRDRATIVRATTQALEEGDNVVARSIDWERRGIEGDRALRGLARAVDEAALAKLAEVALERLQIAEIVRALAKGIAEIAGDVAGVKGGIEELREAIAAEMREQGKAAEIKLSIYELEKELERLQAHN
jgi:hypothetical protein